MIEYLTLNDHLLAFSEVLTVSHYILLRFCLKTKKIVESGLTVSGSAGKLVTSLFIQSQQQLM